MRVSDQMSYPVEMYVCISNSPNGRVLLSHYHRLFKLGKTNACPTFGPDGDVGLPTDLGRGLVSYAGEERDLRGEAALHQRRRARAQGIASILFANAAVALGDSL